MNSFERMAGHFESPLSELSPQELASQLELPKEEWSDQFKQYIAKKAEESKPKPDDSPELSPEEERKEDYKKYLRDLSISEEELQNKRILDLGCGKDANFVKEVIDRNLSKTAYGLDEELDSQNVEDTYKNNLIKGDFTQKLLVDNLDYIVSYASVSFANHWQLDTKTILKNAIQALNSKGEIRIYPIDKAPNRVRDLLPGSVEDHAKWVATLNALAQEEAITWELQPVDIRVWGEKHDDATLQERLVIYKK